MNRIKGIFEDLRQTGSGALVPYVTVGDPDVETTGRLLTTLACAGAAIVELGIPFSDPIADGPVIQASMTHALKRGFRLSQLFEMVAAQRDKIDIALVAMVSYSVVHRIGVRSFVSDAHAAGFDGLILPDLPVEESADAVEAAASAGLILSLLVAPTTPARRVKQIAEASSGFVYLLSRAGLTGERQTLPPQLPQRIQQVRQSTHLPIAVGFGISNSDHVREVVNVADAAIVGTAVMRQIAEHRDKGQEAVIEAVGRFASQLATGLVGKRN